jgi:hypothetical protein
MTFLWERLAEYTGIHLGYVRPSDRLLEDLHFPAICWFDWPTTFCDDFLATFGVDLSDCFDESSFETLQDLVEFLNHKLIRIHD